MKMKLWKKIAFTTAISTTVVIPAVATSCTFTQPEEPEVDEPSLNKIKINLPEKSLSVEKGSIGCTKKAIGIECFDQNGKHFDADVQLSLLTSDGKKAPAWIWIDKNNQINVNGDANPNEYDFRIYAQDKSGKVKSNNESFSVNIYENPFVAPDQISLSCDTEPNIFYATSRGFNLTVHAYKSGVEPDSDKLIKDCKWDVLDIKGNFTSDLRGNNLFLVSQDGKYARVYMSTNVDVHYCGEYTVIIKATSIANPSASTMIQLKINALNGFHYVDQNTTIEYLRSSLDCDWTVFKMSDKETRDITPEMLLPEIYGSRVSIIRDDFYRISEFPYLTSVILPDYIVEIQDDAFKGADCIFALAMPGVKKVGARAFKNCTQMLLSWRFAHPKLEEVGEEAFFGCKGFSLLSDNKFTTIGDYAFAESGLTKLVIGDQIKTIGNCAFSNCEWLKTIEIGALNPPVLNGPLFGGSTELESIKVPISAVFNYKNDETWQIYENFIIS